MTDIIDQYTHRPNRCKFLDGSIVIEFGIYFLFFALMMRLFRGIASIWYFVAVFYGLMGIVWAVVHFGKKYIRQRLVYPRSGYLKMHKRPWKLAPSALLACAIGSVTVLYFAKAQSFVLSPPLIMGSLIGLGALIGALWHRVKELVAFSALSIVFGTLLQFIEPTRISDTSWYFLLNGVALIIIGVLMLYFYIRRTPPRNLEAE